LADAALKESKRVEGIDTLAKLITDIDKLSGTVSQSLEQVRESEVGSFLLPAVVRQVGTAGLL
jgi:hypothetical protein